MLDQPCNSTRIFLIGKFVKFQITAHACWWNLVRLVSWRRNTRCLASRRWPCGHWALISLKPSQQDHPFRIIQILSSGKFQWGLSNGGLRPLSAICAQASAIVYFSGPFGPLSVQNGDHGRQLWTIVAKYLEQPFAKPPFKLSRLVHHSVAKWIVVMHITDSVHRNWCPLFWRVIAVMVPLF